MISLMNEHGHEAWSAFGIQTRWSSELKYEWVIFKLALFWKYPNPQIASQLNWFETKSVNSVHKCICLHTSHRNQFFPAANIESNRMANTTHFHLDFQSMNGHDNRFQMQKLGQQQIALRPVKMSVNSIQHRKMRKCSAHEMQMDSNMPFKTEQPTNWLCTAETCIRNSEWITPASSNQRCSPLFSLCISDFSMHVSLIAWPLFPVSVCHLWFWACACAER